MAANGFIPPANQHRRSPAWLASTYSFLGSLLVCLAVFAVLLLPADTQHLSASESTTYNERGICKSVDIRNTLDTFQRLKGCRVVEGFVQVLLFDNVNETLLSDISFPELIEITDFLLLYRVNGLRSVGQLFPNLTVIRGENLFLSEYSFVIFEMSRLQEIGLHSLTDITKGLVRIDKNPSLCFVKTIDWARITQNKKREHFIYDIKADNECPVCPSGTERGEDGKTLPACPKTSDDTLYDPYLCWNRQHCQKICPPGCLSCNDRKECCSELCLGGCSNNNTTHCTACRYYSIDSGNQIQCLKTCPPNLYKYLGRCITMDECIKKTKPIDLTYANEVDYPYKIFNGSCVLHCPPGYTDDNKNNSCQPCKGKCKKECPGQNVDSITVTKDLKGCTVITGSLEIQIRGEINIVNQLEENLGMIEEIYGYLKIVRSFPLVSLNFLKSLKRIRGDVLESGKYVFIVLDNQNLQELWEDWSNRTLKIDKGSLFFHFNPKLCLNKIEMLRNKTNLEPFTDLEVAKNSNGDKIACNVSELIVNVTKVTSHSIILGWKPFEMEGGDDRQLLGYTVYSIEAPLRDVTLYDGRDACGVDKWRVDDVTKTENIVTHPLHRLKAYTQYAFYVSTYTVATEKNGAQSEINYSRTLPAMPSPPIGVQAVSNDSESMYITWKPPSHPNGNVTYYIVSGRRIVNDIVSTQILQACKDKKVQEPPATEPPPLVNEHSKFSSSSSCNCTDKYEPNKKRRLEETASISNLRIKFEDALQNTVFIKRKISSRRKREIEDELDEEYEHDQTFKDVLHRVKFERYMQDEFGERHRSKRESDMSFPQPVENPKNTVRVIQNQTEDGKYVSFSFHVYGKTDFYVTNLFHYTYYNIHVQACREAIENDTESLCSEKSVATKRTIKKPGADIVRNVSSNTTEKFAKLIWEHPEDPNGVIYGYRINLNTVGVPGVTSYCINRNEFKDYSIDNLMVYPIEYLTGNLTATISTTTSAGESDPSKPIYFEINESKSVGLYFGIAVLIIITALVAFYVYWKKYVKDHDMRLIPTVNPEYDSSKYIPDEWEVPREKIKKGEPLGNGSFGMVYEGEARDICGKAFMMCAIKTVNAHATDNERREFLNEASVMKAFNTEHVVRLLGIVSVTQPTLMIMELMANGDLKSYLRSCRPDQNFESNKDSKEDTVTQNCDSTKKAQKEPPSLQRIYQMAIEIADGMAYLASKKFVHRDLAARNCMVAEDLTVKIGDFGMTRDVYETDYYRKGTRGLLPVRWMPPESLRDGVFTSSSDIWSYGVVLWEIVTLALQPYYGYSNEQVLAYVIHGGLMARPENCPDKLYNLMKQCWRAQPSERPTFLNICSTLLDEASPEFATKSFYHSPAGVEAHQTRPTPSPSQDEQTTPLNEFHDLPMVQQRLSVSDSDISLLNNHSKDLTTGM